MNECLYYTILVSLGIAKGIGDGEGCHGDERLMILFHTDINLNLSISSSPQALPSIPTHFKSPKLKPPPPVPPSQSSPSHSPPTPPPDYSPIHSLPLCPPLFPPLYFLSPCRGCRWPRSPWLQSGLRIGIQERGIGGRRVGRT